MLASTPDLLRLVAVPVVGWAAWRDVRTRRVPNRAWLPLLALGVALLAWDGLVADRGLLERRLFLLRVGISLGFVVPLSYVIWRLGGFGGADAKALMVLAVLFPTYPTYYLPNAALPVMRTTVGVFSMTILTNTVLVGALYPLGLAVRNAARGDYSPLMFIGRPVPWNAVPETYGRLLETPDGLSRKGLDLDALRMYLSWRGATLGDLRTAPDVYRARRSIPDDTHPPGDGTIPDGGMPEGWVPAGDLAVDDPAEPTEPAPPDPWGAEAFLDDVDHAYGTTPERLRDGMEVLVDADRVWITPGIPFIVPMFAGLVVALTYGDLLFAGLSAVGLVSG